ncbi:hypothetical protein BJ165DRAFT_1528870 [Panaeolus papilionaceus]|nr:hypothetical protein BJ165DRAFT_1528870 [Panaeolus papilionaceus]
MPSTLKNRCGSLAAESESSAPKSDSGSGSDSSCLNSPSSRPWLFSRLYQQMIQIVRSNSFNGVHPPMLQTTTEQGLLERPNTRESSSLVGQRPRKPSSLSDADTATLPPDHSRFISQLAPIDPSSPTSTPGASSSSRLAPRSFLKNESTNFALPTSHQDSDFETSQHPPSQPTPSFPLPSVAQPVSEPEGSQAAARRSFSSDSKLVIPSGKWGVTTSWQMVDPARAPIPHKVADLDPSPMEKQDLLHIQLYKTATKDNMLALVQQVTNAEAALNQCEKEEASLLLALEIHGKRSEDLETDLALALARATRTTIEARRLLADAKLIHAQALVRQLVDELEEVSALSHEADHQLVPIIDAFKDVGWQIDDIAEYCLEIVSSHPQLHAPTPSPLTLVQLKDTISQRYPRAPSVPDHSPTSPILDTHELVLDGHGHI